MRPIWPGVWNRRAVRDQQPPVVCLAWQRSHFAALSHRLYARVEVIGARQTRRCLAMLQQLLPSVFGASDGFNNEPGCRASSD
jgi:hypothetical protein